MHEIGEYVVVLTYLFVHGVVWRKCMIRMISNALLIQSRLTIKHLTRLPISPRTYLFDHFYSLSSPQAFTPPSQ